MMNPIQAIKTCFLKYAVFSGRARRSEFWWFFLADFIARSLTALTGPLGAIYSLATVLPWLAVLTRRLHDTGRSGWHVFALAAVPASLATIGVATWLAGASVDLLARMIAIGSLLMGLNFLYLLLLLVWCIFPSGSGENEHGPNPVSEAS